jgi:hypothetical protein
MSKASRRLGWIRIAFIAVMGSLWTALSACGGASASSNPGTSVAQAATVSTGTPISGSTSATGSKSPAPAPAPAPKSGGAALPRQPLTLGWEAPTQNSDGSPLTDLVGYKIHYGVKSQDYTGTVALNNASLTRYVLDTLPAGKYYFAIAAYNSKGIEGSLSQEVSASMN